MQGVIGSIPIVSTKKLSNPIGLLNFFIRSEGSACNQRAKPVGCDLRPRAVLHHAVARIHHEGCIFTFDNIILSALLKNGALCDIM